MFPGHPHPGYVRKTERVREREREREKSGSLSPSGNTVSESSRLRAFLLTGCVLLELTKPSGLA